MRRWNVLLAVATVLGSLLPAAAAHCDSNPDCNGGRGSVEGYDCVRSEINPNSGEFNGRICEEDPNGETWYVYLRYIGNREPVVVCHNGQQVYPQRDPNAPDFCKIVRH